MVRNGNQWKISTYLAVQDARNFIKPLKALIKAESETVLRTIQFQGFIADLAPKIDIQYKRIFRQRL